ncbi:NADH:ubiquinone reductase [Pseudoneurospora amorphoporcata]|uniref:NADH:ubiquinone reductase n=1 Tax=Pseudoneurospora amorphoporcata TaxID=241081 RepID=A0AAN6NV50_9PEZI|nr:NADH:ubiquinone reductase [Pseudoneurospora amorphoporcata]
MAPQEDDDIFRPKDAIKSGVSGALFSGGAGLLIASLRTSMKKNNVGSMHVFTHGGGTIISFAFAGGIYRFAQQASANLRQKEDAWNHAIGAFLGGSVMGLRSLRFPVILGFGALTGAAVGIFAFTGGSLSGHKRDRNVDEFERKEAMRLNRRRPVEETLAEVGEGRGIYPPGYEERRRQRLLEKYGVEVKPVSVNPSVASA